MSIVSTRQEIADPIPVPQEPARPASHPSISIVVPVVERSRDVKEVYRAYSSILVQLSQTFEFIFVVDGGDSAVVNSLKNLQSENRISKVIALPYCFGESTALAVGFEHASGEIIITLPAYFQTVPEGIEKILHQLNQGYDLVVTRRWPRLDTWLNRIQTRGFHALAHRLTGIALHDLGCGLRGMKRQVAQEVSIYGDLHRFLPLLAHQKGFRLIEIDIPQHPADGNQRIYRPGVYLRRILDLLTVVFLFKFTKKPLRFFGLIGSGLFASGFIVSSLLALEKLLGVTALADRPLLILGVLLMVLGVQVGSIGLLGEIIIFTHARKVKDYTIRRFLR